MHSHPFRHFLAALLLAGLAETGAAAAAPVTLSYTMYAGALTVIHMQVRVDLTDTGYGLALAFQTAGLYGALVSGDILSTVQGRWVAGGAAPAWLDSHGTWRGRDVETEIDYRDGVPIVRRLEPPNAVERAPVPPDQRAHTIDTLSALALLVHRASTTGRCDGAVTTYDGRRLTEIEATTAGTEVLAPASRSAFTGPALRCDFAGHQIGGFAFDEDPARAGRPKRGSAWLAPVAAGGALLPVRLSFETGWFGDATMYLDAVRQAGAALSDRN